MRNDAMHTFFVPDAVDYDGAQIRSLWAYREFGLLGDSIVAFVGVCDVKPELMVDIEDLRAGERIFSRKMLHFIVEHFDANLEAAVLRQRVLAGLVMETILRARPGLAATLRREGDDLYDADAKLSVSIATATPVSTKIHFGINVDAEGAPVKAAGLGRLRSRRRTLRRRGIAGLRRRDARCARGALSRARGRITYLTTRETDMAKTSGRLEKLREEMRLRKISVLLLTDFTNVGYVTGFTGGDSFALITRRSQYILTDSRFTEQAAKQAPAFTVITRKAEMLKEVDKLVRKHRLREISFEAAALSYDLFTTYRKSLTGVKLQPEKPIVQKLRRIKDAGEIRTLRKAVRIAEGAMRELRKNIRPGVTENDLAAELEYHMRQLGATKAAFETIVASGPNSSMPHAQCTARKIGRNDAVTIDWGARFDSYNSDLTRVFFIGRIKPRFRKIYEITLGAQKAAIAAIKPGVSAHDIDTIARDYIAERGYGPQFGHSLGHGLGLDVHEAPRVGQRVEVPLEAGMVCTVEPGIYVPGFGGVRVEDDVLVTKKGCEVLSVLPREFDEVVL